MFVSHAHSFRQQARLAVTLAWVAGYTDIVTLLACGAMTSHVSGTTSTFGQHIFNGSWRLAAFGCFLLAMFFLGSAVSGFCTELGRRRGWESIYVFPMIVEALLLALFAVVLNLYGVPLGRHTPSLLWMTGLASAAMGLQNATITHISSGLVRTTHVTGVLTDLGHEAVQFIWWLRDARRNVPPGSSRALLHSVYAHPTAQRLVMLGSILVTFALGAGLGTFAFAHTVHWVMFPPVAFLVWIIYQDITRPIAEIEPSTLIGAGKSLDLPESLAVFHLRRDHDRQGHVHRMPNLLDWAGRLPVKTRVVILDLTEVTQLDENAAMELQAVLAQFTAQERTLIISGLNAEQFQQINGMGEKQLLEPEDVCTDLELAIARGLNRLEGIGVRA